MYPGRLAPLDYNQAYACLAPAQMAGFSPLADAPMILPATGVCDCPKGAVHTLFATATKPSHN